MPRKPHPADLFNGAVVANAKQWSAFTQGGGRLTRHFGSRADARDAAQRMADQFRRPALVYAIDGNGRSAIADTIQPSNPQEITESMMTTTTDTAQVYGKRFNAQRAAKKQLGADAQEGVDFRTAKIEGGYAWEAIETAAPAQDDEDFTPPAFLRRNETVKEQPAKEADEAAPTPEPEAAETERPSKRRSRKAAAATENATAPVPLAKGGKRAAIEEEAKAGALPTPPDFSAATHARFRAKLAKLVALAEAGDAEGLKAFAINPVSTSPKAMARYRDLVVIAIEAKHAAG